MADAPPPYPGTSENENYQTNIAPYPTYNSTGQEYPPNKTNYPIPQNNAQQVPYPQAGVPYQAPMVVTPAQTVPQNTTIVVSQPLNNHVFREMPAQMQCPYCRESIATITDHQTGGLTWLLFGAICLTGLWCGCCLIPFCVDGVKDVQHSCPNCNRVVGVYHRL